MGFLYLALRGVEITLYTEAEYGVIEPAYGTGGTDPEPDTEVGAAVLTSTGVSSDTQVVLASQPDTAWSYLPDHLIPRGPVSVHPLRNRVARAVTAVVTRANSSLQTLWCSVSSSSPHFSHLVSTS